MNEVSSAKSAPRLFSVVLLSQEGGDDKTLDDNRLFSTRENALAFLRSSYDTIVKRLEGSCGIFSNEFSEDGWYAVADNEDGARWGYVSEGLEVDAAF